MDKSADMANTCPAFSYASIWDYASEEGSCPAVMVTKGPTAIETTLLVFHIFLTIVPIVFSVAFAIVASRKINFSSDTWKFLLDFVIIVIPIILNVTVCNSFVEALCVFLAVVVVIAFRKCRLSPFVDEKHVVSLGHQPNVLTLLRSTINVITAVCILAIDFSSFPKMFWKSRTYGVGLMDTGIGLFVFSMGAVSKPLKSRKDFMKLPKMVGPALLLGLARTIVIQALDYPQDDTEYGTHSNAFFTLGLTKLFGGIVSAVVTSNFQLLLLGGFILAVHEGTLLYGVAQFVLDPDLPRDTFFHANREGICSLPGFVGIYLLAMYIARYLFSESTMPVGEYTKKVKRLAILSAGTWIVMLICIFTIKISRRICNFGYVMWIFSIALTVLLFYIILYDYAFHAWSDAEQSKLPSLMEATNRNGLVFFLIANVLTGMVNMSTKPRELDDAVSILILSVYMLLSSGLVYLLLRMRIKIA